VYDRKFWPSQLMLVNLILNFLIFICFMKTGKLLDTVRLQSKCDCPCNCLGRVGMCTAQTGGYWKLLYLIFIRITLINKYTICPFHFTQTVPRYFLSYVECLLCIKVWNNVHLEYCDLLRRDLRRIRRHIFTSLYKLQM
jgi:hypothetical protein